MSIMRLVMSLEDPRFGMLRGCYSDIFYLISRNILFNFVSFLLELFSSFRNLRMVLRL